jgi:hypothetical protein
MWRTITPNVLQLPTAALRYRLYYTQSGPDRDYNSPATGLPNSAARVLSALSDDGVTWHPVYRVEDPSTKVSLPSFYEDPYRVGHMLKRSRRSIASYRNACGMLFNVGFGLRQEEGVRLGPHADGASLRSLCPDVVPTPDGRFRMFYEAQPVCTSLTCAPIENLMGTS